MGFEVEDIKIKILSGVKSSKGDIDLQFPPVYEKYWVGINTNEGVD